MKNGNFFWVLFILVFEIFSQTCFAPYEMNKQYSTDSRVSYLNKNYQANWTTQETPGVQNFGGWKEIGNCKDESVSFDSSSGQYYGKMPCYPSYKLNSQYSTGNKVSYLGKNYQANWTTQETPGVQNFGGWKEIGNCSQETIVDLSNEKDIDTTKVYDISQFVLFAKDNMSIASSAKITGNIGSLGGMKISEVSAAWKTIIRGDIYAKYTNFGYEVIHEGRAFGYCDSFSIPTKGIPSGSQKIDGKWQEDIKIQKGNYSEVSIKDGGSLQLSNGVYNIKNLNFNSNSLPMKLNLSAGEFVELNVDTVKFGSGISVVFSNKKSPLSFTLYTNQKELVIPDNSEFNGIIIAPNAKVTVNSDTKITGAIYAKEISIGFNVVINGVPMLNDIFHSEYNFAPKFSPIQTQYFSLIAGDATIDFVEGISANNKRATVTKISTDVYVLSLEEVQNNIVSYYKIEFKRNYDQFIYVNSNGNGDGSSWHSPLNSLQSAINLAHETGKEIRVAEGFYGKVVIGQGIKITGGFEVGQTDAQPQGSPYETILTAGKLGQTVVINGFEHAKSVKIKGLTISEGSSQTSGGGIFCQKVSPKIEECIIRDCYSREEGAGFFANGGIQDLQMVLFENNVGKSTLYIDKSDSIKAERAVFSQNKGIGVLAKNAKIEFVNSIFYGNDTAIMANGANLSLIHCTSAKNKTAVVSKNSKVTAVNSIFWNDNKEFDGSGFNVTYSCVRNGFSGEGNIKNEPMFVDVDNPKGGDGEWRTLDDGLRLKKDSPCIDKGTDNVDLAFDFIEMERPLGDGFEMGAYEIPVLLEGDIIDYGILTVNNEFIFREDIGDVIAGLGRRDLYRKVYTKSALTLRVFAEKNKYTDVNSKTAKVVFRDVNGNNVSNEIYVDFYRNRALETSSYYAFTSRKVEDGQVKGKVLFLVAGDVEVKPQDPFYVLKVANSVSDGQEYVSGSIHVIVSN
jgi:hypothetical protein